MGELLLRRNPGIIVVDEEGPEPDIFEDFSTYTSTANMISNPRGIYSTSEDSLGGSHGEVVLDTSIGYGSSDRSMRYNWFSFSTPGAGGTLQRRINYGNRPEVWVEAAVRFSSNFTTDNGYEQSGAAYKFLFNLIANPPSGRFDFGLNGAAGTLDFDFPSDVYAAAHMTAPYNLANTWRDEQWHLCQMHIRVSGGRGDLGEIRVDEGPWYVSDGASTNRLPEAGNAGPWNTATAGVRGWAFGANLNERPTNASVGSGGMSNWWGLLRIWFTEAPSWDSGH